MPTLSKEERLWGEGPVKMLFSRGRRFSVDLSAVEASLAFVQVQPDSVQARSKVAAEKVPGGGCGVRPLPAPAKKRKKGKPSRSIVPSLQVVYLLEDEAAMPPSGAAAVPCRLMVHAPKRAFKHAVDRNRVKRLLREAYRAHKDLFAGMVPSQKKLLIFLQFTGNRNVSLPQMNAYVEQALKILSSRLHHA